MSNTAILNWTTTTGDSLTLEVPFNITKEQLDIWAQRISLLVDIEMRDPELIPYTNEAIAWARAHYQTTQREA